MAEERRNIIAFNGKSPTIGREVFLADSSRIIGDVELGDKASVWFGAVLRGDTDSISIGHRSNVQDNAVVHADPGYPASIGHDCIIGHGAVVHGCTLHNHVLVGMHATVLNGAVIGEYCIIGANALVTSNTIIPPFSMVLGSPAKVVGTLSSEQMDGIDRNAEVYCQRAKDYLRQS